MSQTPEKETKPKFVLADNGSICLDSEVDAINLQILQEKEDAETRVKEIELQAKKSK